jgi:hypothetical protein
MLKNGKEYARLLRLAQGLSLNFDFGSKVNGGGHWGNYLFILLKTFWVLSHS